MLTTDNNNLEPVEDGTEAQTTMGQSIFRSAVGLALFAIITAGLIALTQVSTADRIEEQIKKARSKALLEIVPADQHDNDMVEEAFLLPANELLGTDDISEAFVAKVDGKGHTVIIPAVAPDGYTGPIRLIIGIAESGDIKGVRVIEHKETPGLGDKIDIKKSDWIRSFEGTSLALGAKAWAVKKDGGQFDQLTGATITPRAIVNTVYKALQFYEQNKVALLNTAPGETTQVPVGLDQ